MNIIGKTIEQIRNATTEELDVAGIDSIKPVTVLVLNDKTIILPLCDEEGNGAGEISVQNTSKSYLITAK